MSFLKPQCAGGDGQRTIERQREGGREECISVGDRELGSELLNVGLRAAALVLCIQLQTAWSRSVPEEMTL